MSFYVGDWLLLQDVIDPKHDSISWSLPDISSLSGHMGDTSNVEELLIKPEDMTLIPTQIQYGFATWVSEEEGEDPNAYREFYVRTNEAFYIHSFTAGTHLYSEFYVRDEVWTEFYPRNENFYVYDFTATDRWTEFYVRDSAWTEFYVRAEAFYVRHFNPVSFWIEFYPTDFA